jgi:hypothetical protein
MAELKGELARERSLSGKVQETDAYTRSFLVKAAEIDESLIDISNAPGIALKDEHPENAAIKCMEYDVKCVDDSGLLFQVDFKYYAPPPDLNEDEGGLPQPGTIDGFGKKPIWSAGSSVTSGPCTETIDNPPAAIKNSAGDPLEDVVKEHAEFRLSVTMYAFSASDWTGLAASYTNAVNSDNWNGGAPGTWKCQGCSAQQVTESIGGTSFTLWEITWEFAYRADTWTLKLLDIGYNQLVGEDGQPSQSGDKKRAILGQDKKPLSGPVGLNGFGIAITPPAGPAVLEFTVYRQQDFGSVFGYIQP